MHTQSLQGRKVLITGGTKGIGLACAKLCADSGATVSVMARHVPDASVPQLNSYQGDVGDFESCWQAMDAAASEMGGIDTLINCAGVGVIKSIVSLEPAEWEAMMRINLTGTFNATKCALPHLLASQRGDVINIGSRAGRYAFPGGTGYCASKFGIQGFSEALFLDLVDKGIAVSLVAPGTVATGFADQKDEDWHLDATDVAHAVIACMTSHARSNLNWIELRPSKRQM